MSLKYGGALALPLRALVSVFSLTGQGRSRWRKRRAFMEGGEA